MDTLNELLFNQEKMKKIVKIEVKKEFTEQNIIDFIKRKIFDDIELDDKPFIKISELQLIKIIKKTIKYYKEYEVQKEQEIKSISKVIPKKLEFENEKKHKNQNKIDLEENKEKIKKISIISKGKN